MRNHGAIPRLDPDAWRLRVDGLVARSARALAGRPAGPVRGPRADRHPAVRRQPPRRPGRGPADPRGGPVGTGGDRDGTMDGRRAGRGAGRGRPAGRRHPRRVHRRRPLAGGRSAAAVRRLGQPPQGADRRGAAGLGDERSAAPAGPRRPAAGRRAGLHRRALGQVACSGSPPGADRRRTSFRPAPTGCCPPDADPSDGARGAGVPLGAVGVNSDILVPDDGARGGGRATSR